jgi:hypothetical protein
MIGDPPRSKAHPQELTPLERALARLCEEAAPPQRVEKRRSVRLKMDQPVRFRPLGFSGSVVGSVNNISLGGAFINSPQALSPGTIVALGFYVRHRGARLMLRTMGEVVWLQETREPAGFGIRFVDPPEEMLRAIGEMTRDRLAGGAA